MDGAAHGGMALVGRFQQSQASFRARKHITWPQHPWAPQTTNPAAAGLSWEYCGSVLAPTGCRQAGEAEPKQREGARLRHCADNQAVVAESILESNVKTARAVD